MTDISPEMGFGPYPVTVARHFTVNLRDGVPIAMKVWMPWTLETHPDDFVDARWGLKWIEQLYSGTLSGEDLKINFPAILEYLPYRKDDSTAPRDHSRHTWFASHGFVCIRADQRGSGSSGSFYYDEYEPQEQSDCTEIIYWISKQTWSNGRVGMYGKSWGGFNGLQVAFDQPEPLKAVISCYSSDDRFDNDIFYSGGCVLGNGLPSWCSQMFLWNARPPDPRYCDTIDSWKNLWRYRLKHAVDCWTKLKLTNSTKGIYWRHASISEDYSKVLCPVLIIGGLEDGYTASAFRMAAKLNPESKAVIGPWNHEWPDIAHPGPTIDFLHLCLQWWTEHLVKNQFAIGTDLISMTINHAAVRHESLCTLCTTDTVCNWPRLQVFLRDGDEPQDYYSTVKGRWLKVPHWRQLYNSYKSGTMDEAHEVHFPLDNALAVSNGGPSSKNNTSILLRPHPLQGANAGEWCPFTGMEMAKDQNLPNKHSCCFVSSVLTEDVAIMGFSKAHLKVSFTQSGIHCLAIRLCHLLPSGKSTRISYGLANLGNKDAGTQWMLEMELKPAAYLVPKGHRVVLAISPTYFPTMLNPPAAEGVSIHPAQSRVVIQVLCPSELEDRVTFDPPKPLLKLRTQSITDPEPDEYKHSVTEDENVTCFETVTENGPTLLCENNIEVMEKGVCKAVTKNDLTESTITHRRQFGMKYPDMSLDIDIVTFNELTTSASTFVGKDSLKIQINDDTFFEQDWKFELPRDHI